MPLNGDATLDVCVKALEHASPIKFVDALPSLALAVWMPPALQRSNMELVFKCLSR